MTVQIESDVIVVRGNWEFETGLFSDTQGLYTFAI